MQRDRVRQELPPDVAAALDKLTAWLGDDGADLWDDVTRTVILRLARQLLADRTLGWSTPQRRHFVTATRSPALQAIVPRLPVREWGARTVIDPLCQFFEYFGKETTLRQALDVSR